MRTVFIAVLARTVAALPSTWNVGQEVVTSSGTIKGHAAKWPATSEVTEYLGIPYALPPVGALRFAPPQAYKSNATFTADKYVCFPRERPLTTELTVI
jgi:carboxylesterase type B